MHIRTKVHLHMNTPKDTNATMDMSAPVETGAAMDLGTTVL